MRWRRQRGWKWRWRRRECSNYFLYTEDAQQTERWQSQYVDEHNERILAKPKTAWFLAPLVLCCGLLPGLRERVSELAVNDGKSSKSSPAARLADAPLSCEDFIIVRRLICRCLAVAAVAVITSMTVLVRSTFVLIFLFYPNRRWRDIMINGSNFGVAVHLWSCGTRREQQLEQILRLLSWE